jgi:hypothetical protein
VVRVVDLDLAQVDKVVGLPEHLGT